jgi:protein involved in polysaccharide export with SLBB domain
MITNTKIYVIGEGVSSRIIQFEQLTTLMRLLSGVGELGMADLQNARVLRRGQVVYTDFYALYRDGDISKDFQLEADDIVFIPSNANKRIFVLGAVGVPQVLAYEEGKTVLDAILRCGGFTQYADREDVKLIRDGAEPKLISFAGVLDGEKVEQNPTLQPGDYVIVASFKDDKIYISGAVNAPGAIIYNRQTRILDAIHAAGGLNEYANPKKLILFHSDGKKQTVNITGMMDGDSMEQNILLSPGDHIVVKESLF